MNAGMTTDVCMRLHDITDLVIDEVLGNLLCYRARRPTVNAVADEVFQLVDWSDVAFLGRDIRHLHAAGGSDVPVAVLGVRPVFLAQDAPCGKTVIKVL